MILFSRIASREQRCLWGRASKEGQPRADKWPSGSLFHVGRSLDLGRGNILCEIVVKCQLGPRFQHRGCFSFVEMGSGTERGEGGSGPFHQPFSETLPG